MAVRSMLLRAIKQVELQSIDAGDPQRWTVARLARETRLDRGTIQTVIDDPARSSVATLARIATALGCSIGDLVEVVPDPGPMV